MKISLVVIRCSNLEVSKSFYEKLGFCFSKEKHGSGPIHYSTENNGVVFELYPNNELETKENTRLGFHIPNLQKALAGLEVQSTYEFAGKCIYVVVDPDGRKIELS